MRWPQRRAKPSPKLPRTREGQGTATDHYTTSGSGRGKYLVQRCSASTGQGKRASRAGQALLSSGRRSGPGARRAVRRAPAAGDAGPAGAALLQLDGGAGPFELGLCLLRVFLADLLQHGLGGAVDEVLGLLEAQVGQGADFLDDLDLLVAGAGEEDVELLLLLLDGRLSGGRPRGPAAPATATGAAAVTPKRSSNAFSSSDSSRTVMLEIDSRMSSWDSLVGMSCAPRSWLRGVWGQAVGVVSRGSPAAWRWSLSAAKPVGEVAGKRRPAARRRSAWGRPARRPGGPAGPPREGRSASATVASAAEHRAARAGRP